MSSLEQSTFTDLSSISERYSFRTGVKAICPIAGRVLLVKERHTDGSPFWTLPGGGIHQDETLREGLMRELLEEIDSEIHIREPVGSFFYVHKSKLQVSKYVVFSCTMLSNCRPRLIEGILDHRWVDPHGLPRRTLAPVRYFLKKLTLNRRKITGPDPGHSRSERVQPAVPDNTGT